MKQSIDLHCHSQFSDGKLSPTDIILRAKSNGVTVLSLTDHDTIDGLTEAIGAANSVGINLVRGIEVSCTWNDINIHILGYGFDVENSMFRELLASLKKARWIRANEIAQKLHENGLPNLLDKAITYQHQQFTTNGPGRPHFAQAMINEGYAKNEQDAFQKWLGRGTVGDVKQYWPSLNDVVKALHKSGAWISLAHPLRYPMKRAQLCKLLREFISAGGCAIEVVNGFQPAEQIGRLANLARNFGLFVTAGSDFHYPKQHSELGLYRSIPEDLPPLWHKLSV